MYGRLSHLAWLRCVQCVATAQRKHQHETTDFMLGACTAFRLLLIFRGPCCVRLSDACDCGCCLTQLANLLFAAWRSRARCASEVCAVLFASRLCVHPLL
ncbi:hypothetical protein TRVL_08240 [Trypanosoma vivax]|nr:hypothetical protein TRVL_08240 [Trypanosoma vivax]